MEIRLTEEGRHIAVITIDNQPRRNAMTREMIYELARLWDELETSDHRCIVGGEAGRGKDEFVFGAESIRQPLTESLIGGYSATENHRV